MNIEAGEQYDLEKGITLFNEGKFFEAHEAWEALWLHEQDADEKKFLGGLLMAAGSFQHYGNKQCSGASVLLNKGIPMIEAGLNAHPNLRLFEFVIALNRLKDEFSRCSYNVSVESLPKIARMYSYC
jgi:predicted metal-dependent hydrolase